MPPHLAILSEAALTPVPGSIRCCMCTWLNPFLRTEGESLINQNIFLRVWYKALGKRNDRLEINSSTWNKVLHKFPESGELYLVYLIQWLVLPDTRDEPSELLLPTKSRGKKKHSLRIIWKAEGEIWKARSYGASRTQHINSLTDFSLGNWEND